ncbi:hypothetical protein [Paenibacillus apiarius]|uniref:Uncharacterized protein n=1 Tax=Paenibacillus apiarius TaxID=46240 RepID=A0ABT4E0U9_9BACL|nr:hypothetical protein [Paenibacillus apiarius]MCY9517056.1 hypothetical protein [Paenibacillus apiarius]MCY9523236.1 hypothetical protein [Paenibacillus apiarius]MCY9554266.1 hypothetical protein [Paenibacillus apiarius]MCY9560877.1 hypothetical protein [Paenibacillus apiarius]MCY9682798.1 hypothetical protein [Paenibacillus apiarius]
MERQAEPALCPEMLLIAGHTRLYRLLISVLQEQHLHPYDVKAGMVRAPEGATVTLRFGENLARMADRFFSWEEIEAESPRITEFFRISGEAIQKSLIDDYFKRMKP